MVLLVGMETDAVFCTNYTVIFRLVLAESGDPEDLINAETLKTLLSIR